MKSIQFILFVLTVHLLFSCAFAKSIDEIKHKRILLDDNYNTIISKLDALEREVSALKAITASHYHQRVAFMADLTTTITGQHHHIYFDDVKLNIGNAYNPNHGTFVAPVSGIYQFTVTACSTVGHYVVLQVNVNQAVMGKVLAGDTQYDECSSKLFLSHLHAGDDVFVQHVADGDYLLAASAYGFPTFTGLLLQAD